MRQQLNNPEFLFSCFTKTLSSIFMLFKCVTQIIDSKRLQIWQLLCLHPCGWKTFVIILMKTAFSFYLWSFLVALERLCLCTKLMESCFNTSWCGRKMQTRADTAGGLLSRSMLSWFDDDVFLAPDFSQDAWFFLSTYVIAIKITDVWFTLCTLCLIPALMCFSGVWCNALQSHSLCSSLHVTLPFPPPHAIEVRGHDLYQPPGSTIPL